MKKNDLLDIPHLIYVMDPMCSWCYGFAPVIKKLFAAYEDKLPYKIVLGGLRPGTTQVLDEKLKAEIEQHWKGVEQVTNQPFDYHFFERTNFVYDTEPACRAVVAVRYLNEDAEYDMAAAVQCAFYAKNNDVTNPDVLALIATQFGVIEDEFLEKFSSEEIKEKTKQDFVIARHLQATAFPSLYLLNGTTVHLLSRGYRMYDAMQAHIEKALKQIKYTPE